VKALHLPQLVQAGYVKNRTLAKEPAGLAKTALQHAHTLLQRCVNQIRKKAEIPGPLAMSLLMDHPDHYCSHEFTTLCTNPFLTMLGYRQNHIEELPISPGDTGLVFVHMGDDYIHRPDETEDLAPVRFFELYYKNRGTGDSKYLFDREHPQHLTWKLVKRHASNKHLVQFSGIMPTCEDDTDPAKLELRAMWVLAMFCPWREKSDLCPDGMSWRDALSLHELRQ